MSVIYDKLEPIINCCLSGACAACCMLLSVWGALMFVVIAILFYKNPPYEHLDGGVLKNVPGFNGTATYHRVAAQCFVAGAIYTVTFALSLTRILYLRHANSR